MSNLNNLVLLKGNVGNTPDIHYNDNGTVVCNFSLAVNDSWKDRNGEWKEQTSWHSISCWGDLAKKAEILIEKGTKISIIGKLATDSWEDKDKVKHYKTYVKMSEFEILAIQPSSISRDDLTKM